MKSIKPLVLTVAGIATFGLMACGDDVTEQVNNYTVENIGSVDTKDSLPECNEKISGQTAYVKDDNAFFGCDGEKWRQLNNSTVSFGDNICSSESLPDDDGFKIICNGDSIGVVYNGADGKDGIDGENGIGKDGKDGVDGKDGSDGKNGVDGKDGTSCKIKASTALTATIACGSETFTMDLTGYAATDSDDQENCDTTTTKEDCAENLGEIKIAGQSQKGPFVTGADVTAYELLNGRTLKQTGKTFGGKIESANGSFNIKSVKLSSQFAYLVADGFYRNEVTGDNSAASIKLRALTNLKGRQSANINLVTHLEYDRVSNLVTKKGLSVAKAKKQAETEIFAAFGIDASGFDGYAEDYNILSEGDGNAALLAISVLLQGDRTEAELTNLLASLSVDLTDSTWDNTRDRASVADWAFAKEFSKDGLESIRKNIEGWKDGDGNKLATAVPAFEKHVKNFWRNEFKLGECTSKNANEIKAAAGNKYSAHYATSDSASVEEESLTRFICVANGTGENATYAWREATDYEKDTAKLPAPTANAIASGMVNTEFVYVVEDGKWRRGTNLDKALSHSCTKDAVGSTDSLTIEMNLNWYKCDNSKLVLSDESIAAAWRTATTAEADTALFGVPASNAARIGNVNKDRYYVFEISSESNVGAWRYGTMLDVDEGLGPCVKDSLGRISKMKNKDVWYRCVDDEPDAVEGFQISTLWRKASVSERDTMGWNDESAQIGDIKNGIITNKVYVYDEDVYGKKNWRYGTELDTLLDLACTKSMALVQDTSATRDSENNRYHVCSSTPKDSIPYKWVDAGDWYNETFAKRANCSNEKIGELMVGEKSGQNYICTKDASWQIPTNKIDSTLGGCRETIKDSIGYADKHYRYCDKNGDGRWEWREASKIEYDTYKWDEIYANPKDGDVHEGRATENSRYVFDVELGNLWVDQSMESVRDYKLRGCTKRRAENSDTVRALDDNVYHCLQRGELTYLWERISDEKISDTYGVTCPTTWFTGARSGKKYGCVIEGEEQFYREVTKSEFFFKKFCSYSGLNHIYKGHSYTCSSDGQWYDEYGHTNFFEDERDGQIYPYITINYNTRDGRVWMAANLNYAYKAKTETGDSSSFCYNNDKSYCDKYGRLYLWSAAMDSTASEALQAGSGCGNGRKCSISENVRGICPDGWRLPSFNDWMALYRSIQLLEDRELFYVVERSDYDAQKIIMHLDDWSNGKSNCPSGLDIFSESWLCQDSLGFSALPAGRRNIDGTYTGEKTWTYFWGSDDNASKANVLEATIYSKSKDLDIAGYEEKSQGLSIRCVRDLDP